MKATLLALLFITTTAAAQEPAQKAAQKPAPDEEAVALANGWALLAAGEAAKATVVAESILAMSPRSVAAGSLLIDAQIATGGGLLGLSAYERWLGARRLEDGYLIRRVARAVLW